MTARPTGAASSSAASSASAASSPAASSPAASSSSGPSSPGADLAELLRSAGVLVCAGSGGVGKTTTAAALAAEGARAGRRAVVVTIDPARRLADALGLGHLTNEPREVAGDWRDRGGSLHALMLDTKTTFDELVA